MSRNAITACTTLMLATIAFASFPCLSVALEARTYADSTGRAKPEPFRPFVEKRYNDPTFKVTTKSYHHGNIDVKVTQVRPIPGRPNSAQDDASNGFAFCRAWLEVFDHQRPLKRFYFADLDPVGTVSGLFVPVKQPSAEYLIVAKLGNYENCFYLVGKQGKVSELEGSVGFVTADGHYLCGVGENLVVFDLKAGKIRYRSTEAKNTALDPNYGQWYVGPLGYFCNDGFKTSQPDSTQIDVFDFRAGAWKPRQVNASEIERASKVKWDFDATDEGAAFSFGR